jgi:putative transposase
MMKSWRRSYIKGERGRAKPTVRKRFVRIKETLYSFKDGKIKVSIKPYEEYLEFDVSKAWFLSRAKGEMGELILNEKYLTVAFWFKRRKDETAGRIAWDCNEKSLDGFSPEIGWTRIDLTRLFHIHRVYEIKRRRLQQEASKKPSLRKVLEKYSRREKDRTKDFIHKLTTSITREFKGYIHGFEGLINNRLLIGLRKHNRNI